MYSLSLERCNALLCLFLLLPNIQQQNVEVMEVQSLASIVKKLTSLVHGDQEEDVVVLVKRDSIFVSARFDA